MRMILTGLACALCLTVGPAIPGATARPDCPLPQVVGPVAEGEQWCCCKGCCGHAKNCKAIPGCPLCIKS